MTDEACFFHSYAQYVPVWWNTSSMGRLEATQTNFLWLLRTNDEALCLYVWVAHLALGANILCVCVCVFVWCHRDMYLCISVCVFARYVFLSMCISPLWCICDCSQACTAPETLCTRYVCAHSFRVCVWRFVRDGGGSAPLTQPLCHADISRVEEIITLCSP